MSNLTGVYRGSGERVNVDDKIGRKWGIEFLKQVFDIDAISNPTPFLIDLLHTNIRGGSDTEEGKWSFLYRDQPSINFNQYKHSEPTANFQIRKEHFIVERHEWVNDRGNLKTSYDPNYEYNKLLRFNLTGDECFVVDYTLHSKTLYGAWAPNTVNRIDEYTGKKMVEYWMSWPLNIVPFYIKKEGIWVRDTTLEDPEVYTKYLEKYRKDREKYLNNNK